jgi:hypothetical protein
MTLQALKILVVIAGVLGTTMGMLLLLAPGQTLREHGRFQRWLIETDCVAALNRRQASEKILYRYHRVFGLLMSAGAVTWLLFLTQLYDRAPFIKVLIGTLGVIGFDALILAGWAMGYFALTIGIYLLVRPSALRDFEAVANRWYEPFPAKAATLPDSVGRLILRAPRLIGMLLLVAGLGCLLAITA